jgi:glycosyltransferase involved in cell wall biosynthesis
MDLHLPLGDNMSRRIVYLDHTAVLSGGELALLRILPYVEGIPHVILAQHGPLESKLREAGVSVEVLAMPKEAVGLSRNRVSFRGLNPKIAWHTARYTVRLAQRLRHIRPDLVHTNSLKSALYGGVAGRLAGVPVVWHIRDRIASDYLPTPAVVMVRLLALVLPARVIANSDATLNTLPRRVRRYDSVLASPVSFRGSIPDAVVSGPATVRRLSPRSGVTVGMVGRLAPWKGQDVFLRAFAEAFAATDTCARIVGAPLFGEDAYAISLERLAESLGISAQVSFVGFREDVWSEYGQIDILVHASLIPEPFGQVVIEGMAAGTAVIAAAAGGPLEIVTPGVDGLLVPPGDVRGLAQAMLRLAGDAALRGRLELEGARTAAKYRPEVVGPRLSAVHAAVLAKSRGAG